MKNAVRRRLEVQNENFMKKKLVCFRRFGVKEPPLPAFRNLFR